GNAGGDHRAAPSRDQRRPARSSHQGAVRRGGRDAAVLHSGRVRRADGGGDREVGQGGQVLRRQGGLTGGSPGQLRTLPPSTLSVCPVMKAASSLVRNETVPTRSSGTSPRLIACMAATEAYSSSMLARPARGLRTSVPGVRVRPGAMALTVTPCGPSSEASARVKPTTPPLLAT